MNAATPIDISAEPSFLTLDMDRLVATYCHAFLRIAFVYLHDAQLAEDAVQETYIKILRKYPGFESASAEKGWVMQVAVNVCRDMLRKIGRMRVDPSAALETIPYEADLENKADDTPLLEIMKLPEKYKEAILLFYYQDLSVKDIAQVLNVSENTVSVRLNRARALLKSKLEGWYFGDETE